MPKKPKELTKNINVRISEEQEKEWRNYMKKNHFSNLSTFVRWCVEEIVEGYYNQKGNFDEKEVLRKKIEEHDVRLGELLKSQQDILKIVAQKSPTKETDKPLQEYQKGIMLNYLNTPHDEKDIGKLFSDLTEVEILNIINELLESNLIGQVDDKYVRFE
ncbi:hypothetical protein LCGC14_1350440 [marine sediment metagenome]|uniref:Uncharacterized protein n=1 Tax=marine sediment metagenome TaxID=412755 RepID=A0A0F9KBR6_9ZZZZ|nr:MAG: hypothetical protein Lokiarch_53740 [Candidatus Lokiarchaeum sp. GC14_75]